MSKTGIIKIRLFFVAFAMLMLVVSSCRKYKYPESTYKGDPSKWSKTFIGKITRYNVNGIDSLALLDKFVDSTYSFSVFGNSGFKVQISACEFSNESQHASNLNLYYGWGGGGMAYVSYEFSKDKKKIKIDFDNIPSILHKNLFISKDIWWQIVRLTPDGNPFKIKTTLDNGNTYEIQIR